MRNIILSALLVCFFITPALAEPRFVEQVEDGLTLKLLSGERVRLIGLNVEDDKVQETAEFVRSLVSGSVVELEYDVDKQNENGELLAYVWFEYEGIGNIGQLKIPENYDIHLMKNRDNVISFYVLLNSTVIKSGYAKPNEEMLNVKHTELFSRLYEERTLKLVDVHAKLVE